MKKRRGFALVLCFSVLLTAGGVWLALFPAARLSPTENRLLADAPTLTLATLCDGSYAAAWDTYATERFPARAALRRARSLFHLALGEREVGGVILCRDGSLSRRIETDERAYLQNLTALGRLRERWQLLGAEVTAMVVPRRIEARTAVLPQICEPPDTKDWQTLAARCPWAMALTDCTEADYWYRTDHHWTAHGAYFAYCRLAEVWGITPFSDFRREVVATDFYGTSDAAAGIPHIQPDTITLYRFTGEENLVVTRDGKEASFDGLYDLQRLAERDKYAVYLGGNTARLEISLGEGDTRPHLVVVRDSFADALLPFLARHFRITAIDPRYHVGSLDTLLEEGSRVLVLCGMQSICASVFFTPLLRQ